MSSALPLAQQLRDRRMELLTRKARVSRALAQEPVVVDFSDTIAQTIDTELTAIDKALARSAQGLLGICEKCGQPISSERQDAVPYAVTCSTCE